MTGALAYTAADSGLCLSLPSTSLIWVIMLAPLGFVLVPSFGIQRMSAGTAAALFRIYAA